MIPSPLHQLLHAIEQQASATGQVEDSLENIRSWIGPAAEDWDIHGMILELRDKGLIALKYTDGEYFWIQL